MKTNLLLLSTILILASCSKNKPKNDLSDESIKGNVSQITITKFSASEKFGEPYKEKQKSIVLQKFNKEGNITFDDNFYTIIDTQTNHIINIIQYNNIGQKVSAKKGQNSKPYAFYKYNADGLLNEYTVLDDKGSISNKVVFTYNNNLKSSETWFNAQGKIERKIKYKQNNKGLLEQSTEYNSSGEVKNNMNFSYNSDDLLEKIDYKEANFNFSQIFKYFDKDEKGNYLKIINYVRNKPIYITERKINYY